MECWKNADAESLPPDAESLPAEGAPLPAAGDAGMPPRKFRQLAAQWKAETAGHSSPRALARHPAYRQIIEMGPPAVPLILRDMQENGGWWYPALRALTGVNPRPRVRQGPPAAERRRLAGVGAGQWLHLARIRSCARG